MLAGCSSTLLSPGHRLRSEASSAQFQACHFPSMSTQRLDLPCSFPRKDSSRPQQPIRPVGLSIEAPKTSSSCSLKQSIRLPPSPAEATRRGKSQKKKRSLSFEDEVCFNRCKRKRGNSDDDDEEEEGQEEEGEDEEQDLKKLVQFGSGNFWLQSGEEDERVCFVPSDVIVPPLPPLSQNPWIESIIVTEIADLGGENKNAAETSQGGPPPAREAVSGSSTSSASRGLILEVGNGSSRVGRGETSAAIVTHHHNHNNHRHEEEEERDGLELVRVLVACVEAITSKNISNISHFLGRLGELASPRGSSIQRVIAYFTEALALRVARAWPHAFHITPPRELDRMDDDNGTALRLLNQVSPIPKFVHFTANEILLRVFQGKDRVHIIDFDIKQGLQWPSLFQSLASRPNPPSFVRITGIGESKQDLIETGSRLAGFADALSLPFEFHPVVDRLEDVRLWMLHVKEKETVAVNCVFQMHKMLYDSSGGALKDFLGLIRSTNPSVVLMAEQEAEHNETTLEKRLGNALQYYSAIFDSVDSSLPLDSAVRMKIEEMFGREIRNIIACEGRDRTERHESFGKWQRMMEQGGFRSVSVTERELLQSQMLLRIYGDENYRVQKHGEEGAALTLSWSSGDHQPLFTVSEWTPVDVAGSSSAYP